jgi:hypothetical protein
MTRIDGGLPLAEVDGETYDKIRQILLRKKLWEASLLQAQAAREEEEAIRNQEKNSNNESTITTDTNITAEDNGGVAAVEVDARSESEIMKDNVAAKEQELTNRANELREELNKLIQQRTELQMEAQRQLAIIKEYEQKLLLQEKEEMDKLRQEHEAEMKMLVEKMEAENKKDEEELKIELKKIADEAARKRQRLITTSSAAGERDVEGSAVVEVGKKKSVEKEEELKVCYFLPSGMGGSGFHVVVPMIVILSHFVFAYLLGLRPSSQIFRQYLMK